MSLEDKELEMIRLRKMKEIMSAKPFPENVIDITSVDHFNEIVNDNKEDLLIVDCWAPWCGPCKAFAPAFEALQKEYIPKRVLFSKLNVDNHGTIAQQFQVTGIPTTLFIKGKKLVHRQVGMAPKAQFAQIIDGVIEKLSK